MPNVKFRNWDEYGEPQRLNPREIEESQRRLSENLRKFRLERRLKQAREGRRHA